MAAPEPGRSPWQRSQRLWLESGFEWDVPEPWAEQPGPVARWRTQAKYQGRHVRPRAVPVPLAAPVLVTQEYVTAPRPPRRGRRVAAVALPTAVLGTVAAVAVTLLTGHGPRSGQARHTVASKPAPPSAPRTIGMYSGQVGRGVFQRIDGIAGYRGTIVTAGSELSDGQVRQQFYVSGDGGASWRLAQVRALADGESPLGGAATRIAGGPAGWLAVGPRAIWTSRDGLTWTLAAAHGIAPRRTATQVRVLTATASGFAAGGADGLWVSRDGMSWRQPRLALGPGETLRDVYSAAAHGPATVIAGTVARGTVTYAAVWLSTDGGSSWTRVTLPAGGIVGLASDAAGFLAVRPDGVTYFSPNGQHWQYAGTIDAAGGWRPTAVAGGTGGFAVTGRNAAGTIVAYTGSGTGTGWAPTGSLGAATGESALSPAVTAGGTVVAAGSTVASEVGQQGVLLEAKPAGSVRSVPLASIPGALVPELAVNGMAAAGDVQVAVGSANGYPAIWRRQHGGSWALMSSAALTSGQDHLAALTGITRGPDGWLAVGVPGPLVFTSADAVTWQPAAGNIAQDLAGAPAVDVAAGPAGYVAGGDQGGRGGVWWSADLTSWHQASGLTGGQVFAVAADAHGFVSAGSRDGQPAVWTTSNGRSWTTIVLPLPAGASSAVLQQVAVKGSRMVALGQATTRDGVVPFAAFSANGGATWRRVPFAAPGPGTTFTALIAGARGFTAVGEFGPPGQAAPAAWTSAGGTAWTRSPLDGLTAAYHITALAAAGPATTAIGSIATTQSQGAFMVGVPAP